jgi:FkbM family methyltransferase
MKTFLKNLLKLSPIPLSKNHLYDQQTKKIMKQILSTDSNCIDVGCHKGEVLDWILKLAPNGHHFGFEPIPDLFVALASKYKNRPNCSILEIALSDHQGRTSFNFVTSNPSYSGILKRKYDRVDEVDTLIEVQLNTLDTIIDEQTPIKLIKIDVEGAEYLVLKGAQNLLQRDRPYVIFEHGLGASDIYGYGPDQVFALFESHQMKISTLSGFLKKEMPLSLTAFQKEYQNALNYYFIAWAGKLEGRR